MTPAQQAAWLQNTVIPEARRWMQREQFVSAVNRLWDGIEGAEADLTPQQFTMEVAFPTQDDSRPLETP